MPFNGSGTFVRNFSWVNDATNSIPITATRMDSDTNDIVNNGLGLALTRDGQGSAQANLPMNGFRHINCGPAVSSTDYVILAQISGLAPLASPNFTGVPTAPTATPGTNSTQIATTQFVGTALSSYLPLSGGTINGTLNVNGSGNAVNAGALGTAVNSFLVMQSLNLTDSNNDQIVFQANRVVNGSGWPSVIKQIYSKVDSTVQGVMQFNDGNSNFTFGLGFGYTTTSLRCDTSNNWSTTGSFGINGNLVYGGSVQPHIFVQSGTPTAVAVGDLWFF